MYSEFIRHAQVLLYHTRLLLEISSIIRLRHTYRQHMAEHRVLLLRPLVPSLEN